MIRRMAMAMMVAKTMMVAMMIMVVMVVIVIVIVAVIVVTLLMIASRHFTALCRRLLQYPFGHGDRAFARFGRPDKTAHMHKHRISHTADPGQILAL